MRGLAVRVSAQLLYIDIYAEPRHCGRSIQPSLTAALRGAIAADALEMTKYSVILKFGITAETATVAAMPTTANCSCAAT